MGFWKTDHLIADDFSAELADGLAYVAGHDDESRPVMVISLPFSSFFIWVCAFFFILLFYSVTGNKTCDLNWGDNRFFV